MFGVVPQAMPTITSYWLYRFEQFESISSTGVVGAGGVGAELINQLNLGTFHVQHSFGGDNINGINS